MDSARDLLDTAHSRAEEFSDMLELLMQIGKGATLRDAEESIMTASCEILKADRSDVFVLDVDREVLKTR